MTLIFVQNPTVLLVRARESLVRANNECNVVCEKLLVAALFFEHIFGEKTVLDWIISHVPRINSFFFRSRVILLSNKLSKISFIRTKCSLTRSLAAFVHSFVLIVFSFTQFLLVFLEENHTRTQPELVLSWFHSKNQSRTYNSTPTIFHHPSNPTSTLHPGSPIYFLTKMFLFMGFF